VIAGIYEGDSSVVNVIEGHPHLPVIAVSGIDTTVKVRLSFRIFLCADIDFYCCSCLRPSMATTSANFRESDNSIPSLKGTLRRLKEGREEELTSHSCCCITDEQEFCFKKNLLEEQRDISALPSKIL
jgi:hypothetical protein